MEVPPIPAEEGEIANRMESGALRDTALGCKMEAEGWEDAGETDRAARAYKKYQDSLTEWLHKKEEIRMAHPDDGSGA